MAAREALAAADLTITIAMGAMDPTAAAEAAADLNMAALVAKAAHTVAEAVVVIPIGKAVTEPLAAKAAMAAHTAAEAVADGRIKALRGHAALAVLVAHMAAMAEVANSTPTLLLPLKMATPEPTRQISLPRNIKKTHPAVRVLATAPSAHMVVVAAEAAATDQKVAIVLCKAEAEAVDVTVTAATLSTAAEVAAVMPLKAAM